MKKSVVCLFIALLVSVNLFGYSDPQDAIQWLLASNEKLNGLRFLMAGVLLAYLFLPLVRFKSVRLVIEIAGMVSMLIVLGSSFFLPYTDALYVNMYPLDFLTAFESAVILMLLGVNSETTKTIRIRHKEAKQPVFGFNIPKAA